jgi:uncharacterized membrane protein
MRYERTGTRGWARLLTLYVAYGLDAMVALAYVAVVDVLLLGASLGPLARAALGLPLIVFLPGYALVTAAFPRTAERASPGRGRFAGATEGALTTVERLQLSFGASVAVLPILGIVHAAWNPAYGANALLGGLSTLVVVGLLVGVVRRLRVPSADRVRFSPGTWATRVGASVENRPRTDTVLAVGVAAGLLLATGTLGLALLAPPDAESFATLEVFAESESGDLVTDGYPTNLSSGESGTLVLGVENHEQSRATYTLVTELQRVEPRNGTVEVLETRELDRQRETVPANETWHSRQVVEPSMTGDRLRLTFLLYRGDPPADPGIDNAYRHTYLWLSVEG